mmetsp:Transcript_29051/g.60371  ORF Transcript_29051/g.60371 Transcript_29051/m.60371 type:complete len:97 (+) Transcript_29051:79-369(+)
MISSKEIFEVQLQLQGYLGSTSTAASRGALAALLLLMQQAVEIEVRLLWPSTARASGAAGFPIVVRRWKDSIQADTELFGLAMAQVAAAEATATRR